MDKALDKTFDGLRETIYRGYLADETEIIQRLLPLAELDAEQTQTVANTARILVEAVRSSGSNAIGIETFLREFKLSTQEGVLLMGLAEALLRIPDQATAEQLIRDTFSQGDWQQHVGHGDSFLFNAGTWALALTGLLVDWHDGGDEKAFAGIKQMLARSGIHAVRLAITQATRLLAERFVMGRSIAEALNRSSTAELYSFDMLGEAAMTETAAQAYFAAYREAIDALAGTGNSVSVKLSALHPRYEFAQRERVLAELPPLLLGLARAAQAANMGLTIDAEECERLDLSLDVFERIFCHPDLANYHGLGLAVQAYQKRALPVIDWLAQLARNYGKPIPLRLVKGAYWDTEIKRAQVEGLVGYPVFTRKIATDVSYLACAKRMLLAGDAFVPQFATHNAHTVAAILTLSDGRHDFEFQRLYGMGEALYSALRIDLKCTVRCRVYAPVGSHEELLPYLVRRLLENGANASFVHRIADPAIAVDTLIADPVAALRELDVKPHPRISLPRHLYAPERHNSQGMSFADSAEVSKLVEQVHLALQRQFVASALIDGQSLPIRFVAKVADSSPGFFQLAPNASGFCVAGLSTILWALQPR